MRSKFLRKVTIPSLALLGVLAATGVSFAATPTAAAPAAPASETAGDYRPSEWATGSEAASAGDTPTLANDVGTPAGGTDARLPAGLGLLGVGLLGLVFAVATRGRKPGGAHSRSAALAPAWPTAAQPPTETGARP